MSGLHRKLFFLFSLFFLLGSLDVQSQECFRVVFYNVENLFDTKDNPNTNDDDFTPQGQLRWTDYRYRKKLRDLANVVDSFAKTQLPAVIGLCEVETDSVLYDLTQKTALRKHKYRYIITRSQDMRGSNVALLYQRDQIKIIDTKEYTPKISDDVEKTTRNILHITGRVISGDTLDFFVCHFPSRNDGIKKTQPYRVACATLLKQRVGDVLRIRKKANVVIMGDFNDYPTDASLASVLGAKSIDNLSSIAPQELYNMFYRKRSDGEIASYRYRGKWNFIDQIIVSGNLLLANNSVKVKDKKAYIYTTDFLLDVDVKYGGKKPFRTYSGFKYLGGTSDHLPIYFDLEIKFRK